MDRVQIIGQATQDQELAGIRDVWENTNPEMQAELLCWLEENDPEETKANFQTMPPSWLIFIQKCATCGLRQAVICDGEPELCN